MGDTGLEPVTSSVSCAGELNAKCSDISSLCAEYNLIDTSQAFSIIRENSRTIPVVNGAYLYERPVPSNTILWRFSLFHRLNRNLRRGCAQNGRMALLAIRAGAG